MIKTRKEKESIINEYVTSIICDRCKKEYPNNHNEFEIQEFHHINFSGGYGSVFGDERRISCDLCQCCLQDLIKGFCRVAKE
jgi:hypothetical protein